MVNSFAFQPDIGLPNIRSKLSENHLNIKSAGQNNMLINGSATNRMMPDLMRFLTSHALLAWICLVAISGPFTAAAGWSKAEVYFTDWMC